MSTHHTLLCNAKTFVSALHGVIAVGIAAVALLEVAQPSLRRVAIIVAVLLVALEVLRTFNVWLVQNDTSVEAAEPRAVAEPGGRRRLEQFGEPEFEGPAVVREVGRHTVAQSASNELRQGRRAARGQLGS